MLQFRIFSAAVNTSDACSPAETMSEAFYPIDESTNVPLDSQSQPFHWWCSLQLAGITWADWANYKTT